MNLNEEISRIKEIIGLTEGMFKRTNIGGSFISDGMELYFEIEKGGILDCTDYNIRGIKDKTPNQIAKFIYDALSEANKKGFKIIKNLEINTGSDKGDKELLNKLMGGNRFNITRNKLGINISLQESGKSIDNPISIKSIIPLEDVEPPKYITVYHATVQPENKFNFSNISSFENGLHVGTYKAAAERVGMSIGNSISGLGRLVNINEKPRLYRLTLDTKEIANLNNPINDDDVNSFMLKNKNEYDGVAYKNMGEDVGSISIVIWNDKPILKTETIDW